MKRISILLLAFFCGGTIAFAQVREPVRPKDRMQFQGYTIRLMPAMGGTFSYDILKGQQIVLHQGRNPFTGSPLGLKSKEDVYKVAQWQIQNQKQRPALPRLGAQKKVRGWEKLPQVLQQRLRSQPQQQMPQEQQMVMASRVPLKVAEELHIKIKH